MAYSPPNLSNPIYIPSNVDYPLLLIKRGTRAEIESAKAASGLLNSEPYLITDEGRIAIGTSANSYSAFLKEDEVPATTQVVANTSTEYTVNITAETQFDLTLTGSPVVMTFPTATAGRQFTLLLKQDATAGRVITWPSSVRWAAGIAPTITATAEKTDVISFIADGTYWLGFISGQNYTRA